MQIQIKDPDAISDIINAQFGDGDSEERDAKVEKFSDKWFEFGDYMVIDLDEKTLTAKLVPRSKWRI